MKHNLHKDYTKIPEHIGHRVFFCEGTTEYNYIKAFADILNKHTAITDIQIVLDDVGSNSRAVLKYAEKQLSDPQLHRKYAGYTPCLIFDCDAPADIQSVISDAVSSEYSYTIYLSNLIFETWLLMFYEDIDVSLSKKAVYTKLQDYLHLDKEWDKYKSDYGKIQQILKTGDPYGAFRCASRLQNRYEDLDLTWQTDITLMNPFTNMHEITKLFFNELGRIQYRVNMSEGAYSAANKFKEHTKAEETSYF